MSVLTVIKKVGEKILSIVEYPFKKADEIEQLLASGIKDVPQTKAAIVGTVQALEAIGTDGIAALAAHGLDVPDDLKVAADVKAFFTYVKDTLFPTIEADFQGLKADTGAAPAAPAPAAAPAAPVTAAPLAQD